MVDPGLLGDPGGHRGHDVEVLGDVRPAIRRTGRSRRLRHREGDRVGDEGQVGSGAHVVVEPGQGGQHRVDHRLHESRMVEVVAQLVQHRRPGHRRHGVEEVLAVLAAARPRRVGARDEAGRPGHPVVLHALHGVGEVRVPVAVAPVDGQVDAGRGEVGLDAREQVAVEVVDR